MATGAKRPASSTSASPFTSSKLAKVAAPGAYDFIGVLGRNADAADWELVLYGKAASIHSVGGAWLQASKEATGAGAASVDVTGKVCTPTAFSVPDCGVRGGTVVRAAEPGVTSYDGTYRTVCRMYTVTQYTVYTAAHTTWDLQLPKVSNSQNREHRTQNRVQREVFRF